MAVIPGRVDGWQQELSGLLGVKHVFRSRASVEHEEEQKHSRKRVKHLPSRAALECGWIWITQALQLQRTLGRGDNSVISVPHGRPTNQG